MADRRFKICDRCKKEIETDYWNNPKDWKTIKIEFGQYNSKNYDLCPECLEKLGWKEKTPNIDTKDQTIHDKLFEVIQEMVAMNMQ